MMPQAPNEEIEDMPQNIAEYTEIRKNYRSVKNQIKQLFAHQSQGFELTQEDL